MKSTKNKNILITVVKTFWEMEKEKGKCNEFKETKFMLVNTRLNQTLKG